MPPALSARDELRVRSLERDRDRLLDPETGIYAKLDDLENTFKTGILKVVGSIAIAVVVSVIASLH